MQSKLVKAVNKTVVQEYNSDSNEQACIRLRTVAVFRNTSHLFTVFLATSDLEQSDITFGGMRAEHIADGTPQELGWCDIVRPELGYWQVQVHAIRAGDKVF